MHACSCVQIMGGRQSVWRCLVTLESLLETKKHIPVMDLQLLWPKVAQKTSQELEITTDGKSEIFIDFLSGKCRCFVIQLHGLHLNVQFLYLFVIFIYVSCIARKREAWLIKFHFSLQLGCTHDTANFGTRWAAHICHPMSAYLSPHCEIMLHLRFCVIRS
jgi:hypothetical protein